MTVYRLTNGEFIHDLSGTGSKLYGGRWNSPGLRAVYTTETISLAVLENLVNLKKYGKPPDYHLIAIALPEKYPPVIIKKEKLKADWKDDLSYTRFIGDEFLKSNKGLYVKLPSSIIDEENNIIINPGHPAAAKLKIVSARSFQFDKRLMLKNE